MTLTMYNILITYSYLTHMCNVVCNRTKTTHAGVGADLQKIRLKYINFKYLLDNQKFFSVFKYL